VAVGRDSTEGLVLQVGPADRLALQELTRTDPTGRHARTIAESALHDGLAGRLAVSLPAAAHADDGPATFLVPATVRWVSGDVEQAARKAKAPERPR
jgi:hypothetical protein